MKNYIDNRIGRQVILGDIKHTGVAILKSVTDKLDKEQIERLTHHLQHNLTSKGLAPIKIEHDGTRISLVFPFKHGKTKVLREKVNTEIDNYFKKE